MSRSSADMRLIWPSLSVWVVTILSSINAWGDGAGETSARAGVSCGAWLCVAVLLILLGFFISRGGKRIQHFASVMYAVAVGIAVGAACSALHHAYPAASDRIYASVEKVFTSVTSFAGAYAQRRRSDLIEAVADMPHYVQGLVPGVVIGDDSALEYESVATMRMLGLSHLTAVSGAHVSLVLGVVIRLFGRRWPKVTAFACAGALYALIVLVGPEASVMRAGMMGMMMVCAIWSSRPASGIPMVCSAVILASIFFPRLAVSLGFELSAVSSLAIIVCGNPLVSRLEKIMPRWCAEFISLPLIAGIATAPIVASIQKVSSLWSVPANAIVAPVIAPLTLCGLAAVILLPVWGYLAHILLDICAGCAWWINSVAHSFARLPGSGISVWSAFFFYCTLLVGLIALSVCAARCRCDDGSPVLSKKLLMRGASLITKHMKKRRMVKRIITALCLIALVGGVYGAQAYGIISIPFLTSSIADDWEIVQCDVGQGAALLVRRDDSTALIDTGPQYGHIDRCLRKAGVRELDVLILSHFDADHVRGLDLVMDSVEVREAWVSENAYPLYNSDWALNVFERHAVEVTAVRAGADFEGWLRIESPRNPIGGEDDGNADSLVVRAQTENYSVLNLADIPQEIQDLLVDQSSVDVVSVAHHGSASQSSALAQALHARVSLISVGHNTYGHPSNYARDVWDTPVQAVTMECGHISLNHQGLHTQRRCHTSWEK